MRSFQGTGSPTARRKVALLLSLVGSLAILLFVLKGVAQDYIQDRRTAELLASPASGDVYIVAYQPSPSADEEYGVMRIEQVTPELLRTHSGHVYESVLEARSALRQGDERFDDSFLVDVSRASLEQQRKSGELVSIERAPYRL